MSIIFFIVLIGLVLLWPYIWRWLRAYMMRRLADKLEDAARAQMGMPPRDKKRGRKRKQDAARNADEAYTTRRRTASRQDPAKVMKEYAVDAEFTEVHSYSSEVEIGDGPEEVRVRQEEQVEDAEYVEIKTRK